MGYTNLAVYLVGLLVVVVAAWVFLTQTPVAGVIPGGIALALILLLVGIGIMASARSIRESRHMRRVSYDGPAYGPGPAARERVVEREAYPARTIEREHYAGGTYPPPPTPGETIYEERRYE